MFSVQFKSILIMYLENNVFYNDIITFFLNKKTRLQVIYVRLNAVFKIL